MAMLTAPLSAILILLILSCASASDPDPLQDTCVADLNSTVAVNGEPCLPASSSLSGDDFTSTVLRNVQQAQSPRQFITTRVTVAQFPALNTHSLSVNRVDLGPGGVNTPHVHPRSSELIYVIEGIVQAGFVDTNNKLFLKTLQKGDLFLIPRGLVHFQYNVGNSSATIIATFNSQNPGVQRLEATLFGSGIPDDVLTTSFQLNQSVVDDLKQKFGS